MVTRREVQAIANQLKDDRLDELEHQVVMKAKEGDEQALAALMYRYADLVSARSAKYQEKRFAGGEREDFFQNATFDFMRAVENFDPKEGSFRHYLKYWIRQSVDRYASKHSGMARTTPQVTRLLAQILAFSKQGLSDQDIANELGISKKRIAEIRQSKLPLHSLESPVDEEGMQTLADTLPGSRNLEDEVTQAERMHNVIQWVSQLDPEAKSLVSMYHGLGDQPNRSLQEIATIQTKATGKPWNKEGVRMKVIKATKRLQEMAKAHESQNLSQVSMFSQPKQSSDHVKPTPVESTSTKTRGRS